MIAGCDTIADIAEWAEAAETPLLRPLLGEKFRSPCYDTLWWFLVRVSPSAFNNLLRSWWERLPPELQTKVMAIDGKRIIGAGNNQKRVLLVELYATDQGLVIAQEAVSSKKSEPQAIPELLGAINMAGAVMTLDALYANPDVLGKIIDVKADFVVALKGNQPTLMSLVAGYFEQAAEAGPQWEPVDIHLSDNQGPNTPKHGRCQRWSVCVSNNVEWLEDFGFKQWSIRSIIKVDSERTSGGKTECSTRFYVSSLVREASFFAHLIRGHWAIENGLHYVMDVVFQEDASLTNTGYSAQNLGCLRRYAKNLIQSLDPDRAFATARRAASWKLDYLLGLLAQAFPIK